MYLVWCVFKLWQLIVLLFSSRSSLIIENIALWQQITVLKRGTPKPKIKIVIDYLGLSKLWKGWSSVLLIVKPETVLKCYRKGGKLFWRLKSHKKSGRLKIDPGIQKLIRQFSKENPLWGASRIKSELALLGVNAGIKP